MANYLPRTTLPSSLDDLDPFTLSLIPDAPETTEDTLSEFRRLVAVRMRELLEPPPKIRIYEWAENHRRLKAAPYRQSKVEVGRGVMAAATEPGVREIVVRGSTQLLKTTTIENIVGFRVSHKPTAMLLLEPTESFLSMFIKEKLAPMISETKILKTKIRPAKGREGDSTATYKKFAGGALVLAAARSVNNLAGIPYEIALLDEVDKYIVTPEGHPVELARQRLTSYPYTSLLVQVCSPTRADGQITKAYFEGDQRVAVCTCHTCGHKQSLKWGDGDTKGGVKWTKTKDSNDKTVHHPMSARYECADTTCQELWSGVEWRRAIDKTRWYQTRPFECCSVPQRPLERFNDPTAWEWDDWAQVHYALCSECGKRAIDNRIASFTVSNLYSPHKSLTELAVKFLRAKDDPYAMQVFVNTDLAEPYEDKGEEIDQGDLLARRKVFPYEFPDGAHCWGIVADTQDNRLECLRVAFNVTTGQVWFIDNHILMGDPALPEVWKRLNRLRGEALIRSDGKRVPCVGTFIDVQGHRFASVMSWVKANKGQLAVAIRGKGERDGGRSEIFPSKMPKLHAVHGIPLYNLSVNSAKDELQVRLAIKDPASPKYIHMSSEIRPEFVEQLTSEHAVGRNVPGKGWVRIWTKKHEKIRNEGMDLACYSLAMLQWLELVDPDMLDGYVVRPIKRTTVKLGEEAEEVGEMSPKKDKPRKDSTKSLAQRALEAAGIVQPSADPSEVAPGDAKPQPVPNKPVKRAPPRRGVRVVGRAR